MVAATSKLVRSLAGAALGLTVLALAGCEDRYPAKLAYPPRSDLLVVKPPTELPTYPDSPGQLDRLIAAIKSKQGETLNPAEAPREQRKQLETQLTELFGSPASPKVLADEETEEAVASLRLDPTTLARGSSLYRRHCLHCHGLAGDGRGPSGPWLNPHPRDYRQGLFKFMSSLGGENRKPRRADIRRVLVNGIEGTSMPAFNTLKDEDLDDLVSYVIHLSLRGEVEFNTLQTILKAEELKDDSITAHVDFWTRSYLKRWQDASSEDGLLKPDAGKTQKKYSDEQWRQSVIRGYKLFTDPEGAASCIGCHSDYGRQVNFRYDAWGTLVRPANVTAGVYRGGRRPIDLFWRIRGGIVPSGMPAAASLSDEQVWDVVNFLQALPHPRMLPLEPDIRGRIYVKDEVASR